MNALPCSEAEFRILAHAGGDKTVVIAWDLRKDHHIVLRLTSPPRSVVLAKDGNLAPRIFKSKRKCVETALALTGITSFRLEGPRG